MGACHIDQYLIQQPACQGGVDLRDASVKCGEVQVCQAYSFVNEILNILLLMNPSRRQFVLLPALLFSLFQSTFDSIAAFAASPDADQLLLQWAVLPTMVF